MVWLDTPLGWSLPALLIGPVFSSNLTSPKSLRRPHGPTIPRFSIATVCPRTPLSSPMKRSLFSLNPSITCPFYVQALQYIPDNSSDTGLTLVFLHAVNLHKETYEVMLPHLLKQTSGISIRDVWCIENPNHGDSAWINRELLSTPKYSVQWTAAEYSRAVHAFLTSTSHGFDFSQRALVGLAHSGASTSLLLIQDLAPTVPFRGLIFLDPAILPSGKKSSRVLCEMFGKWAKSKRRTWNSRAAALKQLSSTAFKQWDPVAVQLFVEHALHPTADGESVTLACSPVQEAAFYLAPGADLVDRPFEIFSQLATTDLLPIHLIVCLNDEYKGRTGEMKQTQIALVRPMAKGSIQLIDGGHMFPQTKPDLCANAILRVLGKLQPVVHARL
ncbi:Alpha/beta hydrolase family-domain-containing protein [Mycena vitilis]|nr:Alpha/beta hydrolase family-domain-containing protein [Mycena vitilis]